MIGLGVAIHLTTQLEDLLPIDYGALIRLNNPFEDVTELALSSPAFWQLLVGHIAQWVLVSIAALTPAAMYFQFDRERLASVQRRWVQEVFRLDPTVRTVRDIEAKYGSQIESAFGELSPDSGLRISSGRRSPVIVATILLVVGWFLVISTTEVPHLVVQSTTNPAVVGGGTGGSVLVWPGDGSFPVSSFFWPQLSIVGYAFLGSYVFTLFHVLRSYQRRDLHPKSYNTIVVRILAAYALALVVGVFSTDNKITEVALFFVGFMPESALVWLREKVSATYGPAKIIPLREPAPLTDLEGIDLYDRTRLAEEGINNVEGLAHADIVELMSSTRISAAQLVDWTDQAILYLRIGGDMAAKKRDASDENTAGVPDVQVNMAKLRSYGIRTASDLIQVYRQAVRRGGDDEAAQNAEVEALRAALDLRTDGATTKVYSIQTVIDTLPDEEWFVQISNWRATEFGAVDSWYHYLDGHDWEPQHPTDYPPQVEEALAKLPAIPMASSPSAPAVTNGVQAAPAPPATTNGSDGGTPAETEQPASPPS